MNINSKKKIIILLGAIFLMMDFSAYVFADTALLAVRREYYRRTGKQWEKADEETQQKFLQTFYRKERKESAKERLDAARKEAREVRKYRKKNQEYRKLELAERKREMKKMREQMAFDRKKQLRQQKMERAKQKIIRQRNKN